jgi:hypothetical protein
MMLRGKSDNAAYRMKWNPNSFEMARLMDGTPDDSRAVMEAKAMDESASGKVRRAHSQARNVSFASEICLFSPGKSPYRTISKS